MCVCNDEHFVRWSSQYLISGLDGELLAFNPHTGEIAPLKTHTRGHGYIGVTIQYRHRTCTTGLHRLVWAYHNGVIPSGMVIDHKDNKRNNNHPSNLRLATPAQNAKNTLTPYGNYHRNIQRLAYGRYYAKVISGGVTYRSQVFTDINDARKAAVIMRKQLHGEWAFDWDGD